MSRTNAAFLEQQRRNAYRGSGGGSGGQAPFSINGFLQQLSRFGAPAQSSYGRGGGPSARPAGAAAPSLSPAPGAPGTGGAVYTSPFRQSRDEEFNRVRFGGADGRPAPAPARSAPPAPSSGGGGGAAPGMGQTVLTTPASAARREELNRMITQGGGQPLPPAEDLRPFWAREENKSILEAAQNASTAAEAARKRGPLEAMPDASNPASESYWQRADIQAWSQANPLLAARLREQKGLPPNPVSAPSQSDPARTITTAAGIPARSDRDVLGISPDGKTTIGEGAYGYDPEIDGPLPQPASQEGIPTNGYGFDVDPQRLKWLFGGEAKLEPGSNPIVSSLANPYADSKLGMSANNFGFDPSAKEWPYGGVKLDPGSNPFRSELVNQGAAASQPAVASTSGLSAGAPGSGELLSDELLNRYKEIVKKGFDRLRIGPLSFGSSGN